MTEFNVGAMGVASQVGHVRGAPGLPPPSDIWSAARGYQRLVLGGGAEKQPRNSQETLLVSCYVRYRGISDRALRQRQQIVGRSVVRAHEVHSGPCRTSNRGFMIVLQVRYGVRFWQLPHD
jgi:hypothetical protein